MHVTRDEDPTFFSTDPDPAQLKKKSGSGSDLKSIKFDIITHHFMLEVVDSG